VVRAKTGCTVNQVGYEQVELLFALMVGNGHAGSGGQKRPLFFVCLVCVCVCA
jgi:hypothetical protein